MGTTRTEVEAYLDAGVEFRKACRLWPDRVVALEHYPGIAEFGVFVEFGEEDRARMKLPEGWGESYTIPRQSTFTFRKSFPYKRREA